MLSPMLNGLPTSAEDVGRFSIELKNVVALIDRCVCDYVMCFSIGYAPFALRAFSLSLDTHVKDEYFRPVSATTTNRRHSDFLTFCIFYKCSYLFTKLFNYLLEF